MPEELAGPYRATLTKLQESGPPMGADRVHQILARELGPRWASTKLVEFDDVPAASASIGQVHKGVWRDGREVAVKIQYPGAAEALLSDLNQLSRVARIAGSWVPGIDVKPIMDELKARMSEELDYHLEARHQRHFATAFRDDDDVLVPDVLVDSHHVLVTEWVDGTPLVPDHRIGHPGGARRGRDALPRVPAPGPEPGPAAARRPAPGQLPDHRRRPARGARLRRRQPAPPRAAVRPSAGCSPRPWPARRMRSRPGCAARASSARASTSTPRRCSTTSRRSSSRCSTSSSPSPGSGCAARRRRSRTRGAHSSSSGSSSTCRRSTS